MSQSSNNRIKDAGRKPYNSLNVAFKPVKGETKPTGQNVRHGLQVLGKVGPRRVPAPTNLPSLRSENSGNDPAISLVPSGQGWVKKETAAAAAGKKGDSPAPVPVTGKAVPPKVIDTQEISLRPNANVGLGIKAPTLPPPAGAGGENPDSAKLTWGNKVAQKQPASGSSQNFHREFPKLGGGGDIKGGEQMKEGDPHAGNVPDANPQAMGPLQQQGMGRMQVPMNMQAFPGGQMQYPYMYPMYPTHGGRMPMAPYAYPPYYPGPGGKMQPLDPRMMERMAKGQMIGMPSMPSQTDRPSVVKDSDLRSLDNHKDGDDNGWAGTHEEVDYSAKLQFDESDDSDEEAKSKPLSAKSTSKEKAHDDHSKNDKNQSSQENWNDFANHPYNQQMMMAYHFQRPPFSGYDPQRGPPPGPHAFPFHGMYPHPMFFQQNMQPQSGESAIEDPHGKGGTDLGKDDSRVLDKKDQDRKARLKKVEESIKKREEENRHNVEIMKKDKVAGVGDEDVHDLVKKVDRSRNNSEASDSSRRSNVDNIPPRFRRQVSGHDPLAGDGEFTDNRSGSESPHLTIMKRKDSVKSEEDVFKKHDTPSEKITDSADEKSLIEKTSDQRPTRHSGSPSLYKETVSTRSERQKRYSSSSDTHEKDRNSIHGSSSSIHKENEKKEESSGKSFPKNKELKDLSETRKERKEREKSEKSKKSQENSAKDSDSSQKINSRFAELKLSKGPNKPVSAVKENVNVQPPKKEIPTKASPWSNVVSGKPPANEPQDQNKSLRDIQLEEEEKSKLKKDPVRKPIVPLNTTIEGVPGDDVYANHEARRNRGMPPDEPRFRSDAYDDRSRNQHPPPTPYTDDKFENRGYERRGRFNNQRQDQRPMRRDQDDGSYRQNFNSRSRDLDNRSGSRGDQRYGREDNQSWNSQRRGGDYNRRDEFDRNDRNVRNDNMRNDRHEDQSLDEHQKDNKDDQKGDRDHHDIKSKRRDEHRSDRKNDNKAERRDDEKAGERKEEHRSDRKDHKNERRDESRGDRRDDHRRNEKKEDHRSGERRDEHAQDRKENERNDRNDRRQKDYKKDSKEDGKNNEMEEEWRKVDKKEEVKRHDKRDNREGRDSRDGRDNRDGREIRDGREGRDSRDGRDNRRGDGPKRDGYRRNEPRDEKSEERRNNYREDHRKKDDQRRDGRRDANRMEREGSGRRYQQQESEDIRPYERRKKDEWANRDYRQSEDYQKDLKEAQEIKEKKRNEEALAAKESSKSIADTEDEVKKVKEVAALEDPIAEKKEDSQLEESSSKPSTEEIPKEAELKLTEKVIKSEHSMEVKPDITFAEKVAPDKVSREKKEVNELTEGVSKLDVKDKSEKNAATPDVIDLTKDAPEPDTSTRPADSKEKEDNTQTTEGVEVPIDAKSSTKVEEDDGKPRNSGGFGVPPKQNKKHSRSEIPNNNRTDRPERNDSYRGDQGESSYRRGENSFRGDLNSRGSYRGGRERGRGRGRGSFRGGSAPQMNRERRPSGERYRTGGASRDESRRRKEDIYEPVSSGEFTDSETDEKRTKSSSVDAKNKRNQKQPPRFQRYDNQQPELSTRGRGRGRGMRSSSERGDRGRGGGNIRGERGRGRGRGRGGSAHPPPSSSPSNFMESKGTDDGESDAYYSADETITNDDKEDTSEEKRISSPIDRESKSRTRGGFSRTRGSGRGTPRASRGSTKNGSFLVNRQQVGNKRNSSKSDKTLSAADKPDHSELASNGKIDGQQKNQQGLEDLSAHSPPKKSKSEKREEPKREIHKEFDLNNIASVVCIDNMKVGVEQVTGAEEEGFVTVTSKKQQKEKRDREREEAKKKMLLEQKQEQQAANAASKAARAVKNSTVAAASPAPPALPKTTAVNSGATPTASAAAKVKPTPPTFSEAPITTPSTEQSTITSSASTPVVSTPVAQPSSTSNVAMAAFGVWEPAAALMRTSQQNGSEMIKTSLAGTMSSGINAWQRPLSISAPTTEPPPVPDPRAVGTGKPSSSLNKSSLVSLPTTDSSSTLVAAPVIAPIGSNNLKSTGGITEMVAPSMTPDERVVSDLAPEVTRKKEEAANETDSQPSEVKSEMKREKSARVKLTKTEKAPRFQSKEKNEERIVKPEEARKVKATRPSSSEKTAKRTSERPKKSDTKLQTKKTIPKEIEKQVEENSPIVFINEIPIMLENQLENSTPRSTLSDADKVVGANKPSLKTQSSLGSFSSSVDANIEEPIMEVKLQESFTAPIEPEVPVPVSVVTDVKKVEEVVMCTPVTTLSNEEERSLETRSLPGTPPLAVKIPEPSPPGPSSDPGRGPSPPNIDKGILPNVTQEMNKEMNEMNRRLLNARRAWDDTPTTWSDTTAVVSSTVTSEVAPVPPVDTPAPTPILDETVIPVSPSKTEASAPPPIEVHQKSNEEKVSVSGGVFANKRTEQQVCKVKPQQQLPTEEIKPYQATPRQTRSQLTRTNNQNQKYASYGLPIDRSLQPASSTLYTSESVYNNEQHRSQQQQNNQALNFQSLAPGRSISTSVSPHSQQRDMVLSSLQVGNMYSANTLQVSQSQFLAWQVTQAVQPTKTVPYQTYTQGSSFTSPVSIAANSPVIMQYGTASFPPQQRSTSDMQRQHVNLMPMQQHQPPGQQGGRLVGMMPSRGGGSHVRRNQGYQQMQSASDGHIVNPNQMPLMLEPNAANMNHPPQMSRQQMSGQMTNQQLANQQMTNQQIAAGQQMHGQQRSDLMKHVHAKPFEPTSQTPPLMQSPPVVAPSSLPLQLHQHQGQQQSPQQAQQLQPSVFNQPTHQDHVQNIHNNFSQPMMQPRQHNVQHGVQHMQHQPPLVASVRPRSIQEHSLTNGTASLPMGNQDRVNNISPFNTAFLTNNMNYKGRSSRVNLQVAVPQTALTNQFAQHALQTGHGSSRSPTVALNLVSGPGPIQRPPQVHQPTLPHDKSYVMDRGVAAQDSGFKQTQRQKMLEDTKKYFEQDQKALISTEQTEKAVAEEKPVSSVAPTLAKQIDLSKHNKVVLPNNPGKQENGKKFDYKKNMRNNEKTRGSTAPPAATTTAAKRIQPPAKGSVSPSPAAATTTVAKKAGD